VVRLQPPPAPKPKKNKKKRDQFEVYEDDIETEEAAARIAALKAAVRSAEERGYVLTDGDRQALQRLLDSTGARSTQREGRILLVDHCASSRRLVRWMQEQTSLDFQRRWGLTPTLDLDDLIKKANLRVVSKTTWRLGTLAAYELGAQANKREGGKRGSHKKMKRKGQDLEAQREADHMDH
jgi:hypothetical protein